MKIFNKAVIKGNKIILDNNKYEIVSGKHSIWIPELEAKITWSYNGRIVPLDEWEIEPYADEIKNNTRKYWDNKSLQSIINEYTIMKELEKDSMVPPIGDLFYIKNLTSDFPYPNTNDNLGVFGYFMGNALNLSKGKYSFEKFIKNYLDKITFSEWTRKKIDIKKGIYGGALGDLQKEKNIVNGYLIDFRRTMWDNIILKNIDKDAYKELLWETYND